MAKEKMQMEVGKRYKGYGVLNEYGEYLFTPCQKLEPSEKNAAWLLWLTCCGCGLVKNHLIGCVALSEPVTNGCFVDAVHIAVLVAGVDHGFHVMNDDHLRCAVSIQVFQRSIFNTCSQRITSLKLAVFID